MRNKIPKIFWVQKYKSFKQRNLSFSQQDLAEDENSSFQKKSIKDIYKIERFSHLRKRPSDRSFVVSRLNSRVFNDYPETFKFKIEKIQRQLIKPFVLKRYSHKKKCDVISSSTKRSSRESSKLKMNASACAPMIEIEPLSIIKVENEDASIKISSYQYENKLIDLNLNQNEDLKKEIQMFKFQEQLEEIDVGKALANHENLQRELESLHCYNDEEVEEVSISKPANPHFLAQVKANYRPRSMSG